LKPSTFELTLTPAIKLLEKLKIDFQVLSYEHDPSETAYAKEAACKLGIAEQRVFKTLVLETFKKQVSDYCVVVIPTTHLADLKLVANLMGAKKADLAPANKVQNMTGYILGGVSPFAQKRKLKTLIDESALAHDTVFVSAGRRGIEIELEPSIMKDILDASFHNICVGQL
jgi:Cys-tRNA(Pro)/Cys-tRNA(Cys) deacylase